MEKKVTQPLVEAVLADRLRTVSGAELDHKDRAPRASDVALKSIPPEALQAALDDVRLGDGRELEKPSDDTRRRCRGSSDARDRVQADRVHRLRETGGVRAGLHIAVAKLASPAWRDEYARLKADARRFRFFNAAQIVKHYLGVKTNFPQRPVRLLYLFWEPIDHSDHPLFSRPPG